MFRGIAIGDRHAVARLGQDFLSKASVPVVAGEFGAIAEILLSGAAIAAFATGPAQPRHAEALTGADVLDTGANRLRDRHGFVPRNDRKVGLG